jgi:NAD+ dependent glucose-6-phosphate dehydrogenase
MKIAVTGAAGHIGTQLCMDLAKDHEVVQIDVRGVDKPVDVLDLDALRRALEGAHTLVHLARLGRLRGTAKATWEDFEANLAGAYNGFEAARSSGCEQVIFASSNHAVGMYEQDGAPAIYEARNGTLLRADTPFRADGLYGVWKAFGEVLGRYYCDEFGLKVACLRIGNVQKDGAKGAQELVDDAKERSKTTGSNWSALDESKARKRMASIYMSHRDLARLVRAIVASDVPYGVVYGVSDNATRFWDLEVGRALYGFWPIDGIKD